MERINTNLNDASIVNSLSVIIALINGFWNVTHD